MKHCKPLFTALLLGTSMSFTSIVLASSGHEHGHDNHTNGHSDHESMMSSGSGMFLKKERVDGYDVSFHVMKAKPGKEMGGSHDIMVKVEKGGVPQKNIVMNTKVIYPDGKSESKKTMIMGDWLMAGYDLHPKGKHQLLILFKTADGKKHKAGVYYTGS